MKLTNESLVNDRAAWEAAGYHVPGFDRGAVTARTRQYPVWVHIGGGNLFRAFHAHLAQRLIESGHMDRGLIAVNREQEGIHQPNDDLTVLVTLRADGTVGRTVIGSVVEDLLLTAPGTEDFRRLRECFAAPGLQMVTFTVTEKGYALQNAAGETLPDIARDLNAGPDGARSFLGRLCALLYARYRSSAAPLALVSTDNCSHNGDKVRAFVSAFAESWTEKGLAAPGFARYCAEKISCPWTMIDKITPGPDPAVRKMLEKDGLEGLSVTVTPAGTSVAPFVNAEETEYLVIEDDFPNGRPPLERVGVIFTDRETVDRVERMKVCTCLNPLHTALAIFGCLLGYTRIRDEMRDPDLLALARGIGYDEGLPAVADPGILDPREFLDTVINVRLPNPFMPDTPQRIAADTSQKLPIRFGATIRAYMEDPGRDTSSLRLIPLTLAAWLRYLMALDDRGTPFTPSPDPMLPDFLPILAGLRLAPGQDPEPLVAPILRNPAVFGVDLYAAGLAGPVLAALRSLISAPGAVRETLREYVSHVSA